MHIRSARRVIFHRVIESRIVGVLRCLASTHKEAVVRPGCQCIPLVHKGQLEGLRIDEVILHALGRRELEQPAARIGIRRIQRHRHEAAGRSVVVDQLVVEIVHILARELHIGREGSRRRIRRRIHETAVHIALHIGLHFKGRGKGRRVIGRVDIRRIVLQRIRGRSRDLALVVDNLVAHIRVVHLHEHLIVRRCQRALKSRERIRIQRQLTRVAAAHFILDRRIAV